MNKFIAVLLIIFFNFFSSALTEEPLVDVRTAIVVDYHSDKILYEYEPDIQIYPASMTKIMTTIIAFDLIKKINFLLMINLLFLRTLGGYRKVAIPQCSLW